MQSTEANTKAGSLTEDGRDRELDILIERRSRLIGDPEWHQRKWDESVRAYHLGVAAQRRQQWARWHRQQAERHRRTLGDLIAHHEAAAAQLTGGW